MGISSGDSAVPDLKAIASATNSFAGPGGVDCNADGIIDIPEGEPLVCSIASSGEGIGEAIVELVNAAIEAATPVAHCIDVTVPTDPGRCTAQASIDNGSFDPDGGSVVLTQFPPGPYPLGATPVTLKATDETGLSDTCTATVTVEDDEPPIIENVTANPDVIWPPNHKMVQVDIGVLASDNCDTEPTCGIVLVTSNELISGPGDGNTAPDWMITGDLTVALRAERSGSGNGRIYTITVECSDTSENSSTETAIVTVPHDEGKKKK